MRRYLVDGQNVIDQCPIVGLPIVDAFDVVEVRVDHIASAVDHCDCEDIEYKNYQTKILLRWCSI